MEFEFRTELSGYLTSIFRHAVLKTIKKREKEGDKERKKESNVVKTDLFQLNHPSTLIYNVRYK